MGFGGRAGVPASQWQSWGHGAQCRCCTCDQGQEEHPVHFSFFIERPGWVSHAHPGVCISHGRDRAERHGSGSWTGCAAPWRIWRSFAGLNGTLVCPIRTVGSSLLLPAWGNSLARVDVSLHPTSSRVGQGCFGGSEELVSF